jgi:hypothetical protein
MLKLTLPPTESFGEWSLWDLVVLLYTVNSPTIGRGGKMNDDQALLYFTLYHF